jgi:hypothetical protein
MKFEYRKFDDFYYVSELHSYNSLTKDYKSDYIGTVKKVGKEWIGETTKGNTVKADTREKASVAMVQELEKGMNMEEQKSTPNYINFTEEEIRVLKLNRELEKVRIDADKIRSAFNMSKETTEQLKKFSQVRRIPLQDLVELAVINLLSEYDK